jgi:hypothetical protein
MGSGGGRSPSSLSLLFTLPSEVSWLQKWEAMMLSLLHLCKMYFEVQCKNLLFFFFLFLISIRMDSSDEWIEACCHPRHQRQETSVG